MKTKVAYAASGNSEMEPKTISRNRTRSKSLTSRGFSIKKVCFALLAASVILCGCKKEDSKSIEDKLVGTWVMISMTLNGDTYNLPYPEAPIGLESASYEFTTTTYTARGNGRIVQEFTGVYSKDNRVYKSNNEPLEQTWEVSDDGETLTVTRNGGIDAVMVCIKLESSPFDGKIVATVEKGNTYNSQVSKVATYALNYDNDEPEEFASGSYANGGFTMTLPQPDEKYFWLLAEDAPDYINISDKNANVVMIENFVAFDNDSAFFGYLDYVKVDNNFEAWVSFWYADRDVIVSGSYEEKGEDEGGTYMYIGAYRMSLKKGWNMVYETYTETETLEKCKITTTPVSGMKWYFSKDLEELWNNSSTPSGETKSSRKSIKSVMGKRLLHAAGVVSDNE
jgi:hypothetical protein